MAQAFPRIINALQTGKEAAAREAAALLKTGALLIMPTDTVYGVAADPSVKGAEERLFRAKARDRNKHIPLLAQSLDAVKQWGGMFNEIEAKLADRFWPGPLTLVLKTSSRNAHDTDIENVFEGFRVPDSDIALAILKEVGGLLRVTSANISGEQPALCAEDAERSLGRSVAMIVDAGPVPGSTPSTVVKVEHDRINILREGAISEEECRKI